MPIAAPGPDRQAPFTIGQSWGALRKAWKGYKIAKDKKEMGSMILYAERIRKLQGELGVPMSKFPELSLT